MIPFCFVLRGRETGTEIFSVYEFSSSSWRNPMLPKMCQKSSVVSVLHVTNRCFRCRFVLDSRAESQSKCHLVVITVEVEVPYVGHNSWQKAERAFAFSVGWARRCSRCFRNEAKKLPVTIFGNPVSKPRGICWGYTIIVKYLRDVYKKVWRNSTE